MIRLSRDTCSLLPCTASYHLLHVPVTKSVRENDLATCIPMIKAELHVGTPQTVYFISAVPMYKLEL